MQEDIRRTVLFLINGFGVDKRDIYDILNDNTQAEYYRSRLRDIQGNAVLREGDKREANEIQGLPVSDEFEYIFLSAEPSTIGTIIKISLGICKMFGYSQTDLVGKHIDFIMPDMYQQLHKHRF